MLLNRENISVLIAEDDFLVSKEIERSLKGFEYTITGIASNGALAIQMAKENSPEIILMDINMPELDGLSAAEKIYNELNIPVIILTAHETPELIAKARDIGVGAYLSKPPKAVDIDRAITFALARHQDLEKEKKLNEELSTQKAELEKALSELKTLKGIIPICCNCKKIRDDSGYWEQVESYIRKHSEANFSHSICPECSEELYGDFMKKKDE